VQGLREYFHSEVIEACHRLQYKIPPVSEYIPLRRNTVGGAFLWGEFFFFSFLLLRLTLLIDAALLEYSLDLDLPDSVFEDPVFIEVDKAAVDIMAWQNVCGF